MTPDHPPELPWGATRAHPLGAPAAPVPAPEPEAPYTQTFYVPGVPAPMPPRRRRRTGLVVGLVAAALVLFGGSAILTYVVIGHGTVSITGAPRTFTTNGTLTISGVDCGSWGYGDLKTGTEVTLTDETGKVLAAGSLTQIATCSFTFTLERIPPGRSFYGVTISHRGTIHYTEAQMRSGLQLSIG